MLTSFNYEYSSGEANFDAPIQKEVKGGAHLTFDVMTHDRQSLYMLRRPDGFHDGPKDALYFPHGLIRYGETVEECCQRLISEQSGGNLIAVRTHSLSSWVEADHWHMCLNVLAQIEGPLQFGPGVSEVVTITGSNTDQRYGWWSREKAEAVLRALPTWLSLD